LCTAMGHPDVVGPTWGARVPSHGHGAFDLIQCQLLSVLLMWIGQ
jgi:hypothetical protein